MPRKAADAVLATLGIACIVALAILRAAVQQEQTSTPSTYDEGANGLAALYALLREEHVPVRRFEDPISRLDETKGAFVVAGDEAVSNLSYDPDLRKSLDRWTRAGGTLVLLGSRPPFAASTFGLPSTAGPGTRLAGTSCRFRGAGYTVAANFTESMARVCSSARASLLQAANRAFGIAYARGRGTVVFVTSATPFDNLHLSQRGNAAFVYALFAPLGPVAFDERAYGYANDKSMWAVLPAPVRIAIVVACVALLIGLVGANLPFAPHVDWEPKHVRDSSEYLHSLASMLRRGHAQRDAVQRFCAPIEKALAAHRTQPAARALLEEARHLEMQLSFRDEDVLSAARLFARVRKDYPW